MSDYPENPPDAKALEAALDFLFPTYRPGLTKDHVRKGDIQCQRLAYAMRTFANSATEELRRDIHKLCPDAGMCQDGMLYDDQGHAMGACEWHGHVIGGHI